MAYLFHISPKMPAPRGIVCSSQLALRAAALSFVGLRFISVILLNLAASDCRVMMWLARKFRMWELVPNMRLAWTYGTTVATILRAALLGVY
jgi:hypothetical protein